MGDSHVDALKAALAHGHDTALDFQAFRVAKLKKGKPIGDFSLGEACERVRALRSDALVVCAFGGNQHSVLSLVQHPRPFDFALPGEPFSLKPGAELIPFHAVRMLLAESVTSEFQNVTALQKVAPGPVIQLPPPPPKADAAHILRSMETYFIEKGLTRYGVTDAAIRLKVWRVQVMLLRELCIRAGVIYLPNPPEALTPEGFLAPDFYAKDATHANRLYGQSVLNQIAALDTGGASAFSAASHLPGE
jgi:hypothetical protein